MKTGRIMRISGFALIMRISSTAGWQSRNR
jgi:hypothetical protein